MNYKENFHAATARSLSAVELFWRWRLEVEAKYVTGASVTTSPLCFVLSVCLRVCVCLCYCGNPRESGLRHHKVGSGAGGRHKGV